MTNWMTGAGLALIAGGLATLLSFRSILFGTQERGARRRPARGTEDLVRAERGQIGDGERDRRAGLGEAAGSARPGRPREPVAAPSVPTASDEDDQGGLASIGFSDDEDPAMPVEADGGDVAENDEPAPPPLPSPASPPPDRYGDRIEGWVRPRYQDPPDEPRPGEYWTPIPVDLAGDAEPSAKGYGWPRPVERLPAVPDYEPATGFDLIPISEPTGLLPTWPPADDRTGLIDLPRSWSGRNEKRLAKPEPRRPRPRPRPDPEQPSDPSTVYVSRHAADPSPRRD
ncbi:hypothetical protein ODJ79_23450 [Actinoplanes sp. KI2]|uniref:hypothetical protein n=1 Tax=Actinoplanes sp. KI2 TaxID=2983315 RepID=UPI0021D5BB78|nr:hypothetical protein [Actinoplanes sp. KI2]MCU7726698.1 hypothetical protein [Actinoplanes sp. KI2]